MTWPGATGRARLQDALLGAVTMVLVACTTSVTSNRMSAQPLALLAPYRAEIPAGVGHLSVLAGYNVHRASQAVFVDARERERYRSGHVSGAVSLPAEAMELAPPPMEILARMHRASFVIVYCDGAECLASLHVARRLKALGVQRLWLMVEGWPAWSAAGRPSRNGDGP